MTNLTCTDFYDLMQLEAMNEAYVLPPGGNKGPSKIPPRYRREMEEWNEEDPDFGRVDIKGKSSIYFLHQLSKRIWS